MKILFVTTGSIEKTATSKRAVGMAGPLMNAGHEVCIVMQDTKDNRERVILEAPDAKIVWFEKSGVIRERRAKIRALSKESPDVVYFCSFGVRNSLHFCRKPSAGIYVLEHSELLSAIESRGGKQRIIDRFLEVLSLRIFDGHVCASRYLLHHLRSQLKARASSIPTIYSPYAFNQELSIKLVQHSLSDQDVGSGEKVLLYMGTLSSNYGILSIISAFSGALEVCDSMRLVVLGSGKDADLAIQLADELGVGGKIDFLGYVEEERMYSELSRAHAFICPLFGTTQDLARCPSKLFMYLPYGRPIVTARLGEAEVLFGGEEYPFYYRSGDDGSLQSSIAKAMSVDNDWIPSWSIDDHSWSSRARELLEWIDVEFLA